MPFEVPRNAGTYTHEMERRAEALIEADIWSGITVQRLRAWLGNFQSVEEKYFAACILDALVYRSNLQTRSLMLQLFHRLLPNIAMADPSPICPVEDWRERLCTDVDEPGIRLVPVIRGNDPPTKSGPLILRQMKRSLGVSEKWMVWPWRLDRLAKAVKVFIFVDDFLGTGYQFRKFVEDQCLHAVLEHAYCIYCPLVAHSKGIAALGKRFPKLRLEAVEVIEHTSNVFDPSSTCFADGVNSPACARAFYFGMLERRGLARPGRWRLGYGNLGLTFAFEHATPNASLPILWMRDPAWHPLFER